MEKFKELKQSFYNILKELEDEYDVSQIIKYSEKLEEVIKKSLQEKQGKLHNLIKEIGKHYDYAYAEVFTDEINNEHKLRIFKKYHLPCIIYILYCWYNDDDFIFNEALDKPTHLLCIVDTIDTTPILYNYMKKYSLNELDNICCEIYSAGSAPSGKNNYKDVCFIKFPISSKRIELSTKDETFTDTIYYKLINKIYTYNEDNTDWDLDENIGIKDIAKLKYYWYYFVNPTRKK